MLEFIKMFGLGVVYTIIFPFIVIIFLVNLVYSFINYLIMECIAIFGFFFGYTFSTETPLEKKLEEMKNENIKKSEQEIIYEYNEEISTSEKNEGVERGSDEQ